MTEQRATAAEPHRDAAAGPVIVSLLSRHHATFAQVALELDDPSVLDDYVVWSRTLLRSRGIDAGLLDRSIGSGHEPARRRDSPVAVHCHLYLAAAVTGRREAATFVAQQSVDAAGGTADVYVEVFQDALYEIGHRWESARLTIAEEHMATATTQFILGVLPEDVPRSRLHRGTAVVSGVAGDRHAVGATIVANVLDEDGWDVRLVGTDLPNDDIAAAVDAAGATLLAVSVTLAPGVVAARDLIALVRARSADPPRIIVGGAAFRGHADLWRDVGADGFAADARSTAAIARGGAS